MISNVSLNLLKPAAVLDKKLLQPGSSKCWLHKWRNLGVSRPRHALLFRLHTDQKSLKLMQRLWISKVPKKKYMIYIYIICIICIIYVIYLANAWILIPKMGPFCRKDYLEDHQFTQLQSLNGKIHEGAYSPGLLTNWPFTKWDNLQEIYY